MGMMASDAAMKTLVMRSWPATMRQRGSTKGVFPATLATSRRFVHALRALNIEYRQRSTVSIVLPTGSFDNWSVTSLRDSLKDELRRDDKSSSLQLFFYAITLGGWDEIKVPTIRWLKKRTAREVVAYVGTDHGITDPAALEVMHRSGIRVQLMQSYSGVFHPKVVWMSGMGGHSIWVASNNLTRDGLSNNIEFAALIKAKGAPQSLASWANAVSLGSVPYDEELIASYKEERAIFERNRAASKSTTFTWTRRREPKKARASEMRKGDLVVEIMPEETRGGNQIQLPKDAVRSFFGLQNVGDKLVIQLQRKGMLHPRTLTITVFQNNTVRLSVNELEYRDRPCVIMFRKLSPSKVQFEIVSESIFPSRYRALLAACVNQTRLGSRRWTII